MLYDNNYDYNNDPYRNEFLEDEAEVNGNQNMNYNNVDIIPNSSQ